ncbi:MAG: S1/P1 Nuclease [Flavobacteriales bacterium]|nr:S1/P1 Nuclease [Flavobacteriales bacterium]
MKKTLIIITLLAFSTQLLAWGQIGHRTIGLIATNHLSNKTKKALHEIMGHESLMQASTWMDEIRSDSTWDYTHPWHYVTIPDGQSYATSEKSDKGDVVEAIERMKAIIKDENSSRDEKRNAVRMLVHLIGDIHQPLHVGNGEDRGGNSVKIKWFYEKSNLHRIWDSGMIDSKQLSYTELAQFVDHPNETPIPNLHSTDVNIWIKEAMDLRPQVYDLTNEENLSYEYMYKNWDTVMAQLEKAGIRLAETLNEIFG